MKTAIMLTLLLLSACAEQLTQEQSAFKDLCLSKGHQWMKMSEMKEGMMTGPACQGCMPDEKTHICTQQEYEAYIK